MRTYCLLFGLFKLSLSVSLSLSLSDFIVILGILCIHMPAEMFVLKSADTCKQLIQHSKEMYAGHWNVMCRNVLEFKLSLPVFSLSVSLSVSLSLCLTLCLSLSLSHSLSLCLSLSVSLSVSLCLSVSLSLSSRNTWYETIVCCVFSLTTQTLAVLWLRCRITSMFSFVQFLGTTQC